MSTTSTSLENDRNKFSGLAALLVTTAVTGYATFVIGRTASWEQWTYLVHTVQGLALSVLIGQYVYLHYRRTIGVRRIALSLSGILAVLLVLSFVGTGLHIAWFGQFESARWVYWMHVIGGTVALTAVIGHVLWHRASLPERRREPGHTLLGIQGRTVKALQVHIALAAGGVLLGTTVYALLPSPYVDGKAVIQPYDLTRYGANIFAPSHNLTANGSFYDVKRLGGAEQCGECHKEIYKEWKSSIHAKAASDKAYQTNVKLLASRKGMPATRYCEGCHAPVPMMSGQLSEGGKLDTPGHLQEGVTCLTCHSMRSVVDTSGVASFLYGPPKEYLFAGYSNAVAREVHDYLIRLNPAQHRAELARPPLSTPEMCATCHAQFMEKVMNDWGWVKMQDDYTSWLKGPFSGQSNHTFAQAKAQSCQDCHLPLVTGHDPSATASGAQHSHRFPGANTAVPHFDGDKEQVEYQTRFLQENRVTVTIDKPTRDQAVRSDKPVQRAISNVTEPPGYFYLGDEVTINTVLSNVGVGHDFPGGTSDINEVWVNFRVTDGQNRVVYESGAVGSDQLVDEGAYFYRSLPVDKEGKLVWRHDLFRMVGDSFKNVIEPGSADVVTYRFRVPAWAKDPLNVSAVVRYRKLNITYARWAFENDKVVLPIVDVASDAISIPLRQRIEAVGATPTAETANALPLPPFGLQQLR